MRGEALPPLGAARSPLGGGGGKLSRGGSRVRGGLWVCVDLISHLTDNKTLGPTVMPLLAASPSACLQDCGAAAAALVPEGSDALLAVSRSALSGSSKTPFPPDRSFVNDFDWTKHSRCAGGAGWEAGGHTLQLRSRMQNGPGALLPDCIQ